MRRSMTGSRWTTPRLPYAGGWRHNPWINAVFRASQDAAASSSPPVSNPSDVPDSQHVHGLQESQQQDAMRTWENEGGSIGPGTHRGSSPMARR
jgi:hypothetical protein